MNFSSLKTTRFHFVTGKGGVGKSSVAAALAKAKAQNGRKTLLVELSELSFYEEFLKASGIGMSPIPLSPNLEVSQLNGVSCLKEYAKHLLKVDRLVRLFFENKVAKTLIETAPGLTDIAILGKITSGPRKVGPPFVFDEIVIDAPAFGHFLSLVQTPNALAKTVQIGPVREQCESILSYLNSSEFCEIHVVALPENLVVQETLEFLPLIRKALPKTQIKLYLNQFLEPPRMTDDQLNSNFMKNLKHQVDRQRGFLEKLAEVQSTRCLPKFFIHDPLEMTLKLSQEMMGDV